MQSQQRPHLLLEAENHYLLVIGVSAVVNSALSFRLVANLICHF